MSILYFVVLLLMLLASTFAGSHPLFLNETFHTGYVPLDTRGEMWYWLFESRHRPKDDPLIVFYTGDADQSAAFYGVANMGPYTINSDNATLSINPYSWNNLANLLFMDPVLGSGFSYAYDQEYFQQTDEQIVDDTFYLLQQLLVKHPEYNGRDVYFSSSGTSIHMVALTCLKIMQNLDQLNLNVKGWLTYGLIMNDSQQFSSWSDYAYQHGLINKTYYHELQQDFIIPLNLMKDFSNQDQFNEGFADSWNLFDEMTNYPNSYNPLNIDKPCLGPYDTTQIICFDFDNVVTFIKRPEVYQALNISNKSHWRFSYSKVTLNGTGFSAEIFSQVGALIETGLPGVVSCGMLDLIWNCIGIEAVVNAIPWHGAPKFQTAKYKTWGRYGTYKHLDNLTFMKVKNSGFFTPVDTPYTSLLILDRLLKNKGW